MAKKITYEEVSKVYEEKGYELISEYKGNNKPLFVKDKEGYICSTTLSNFKAKKLPSRYHKNNPYTIDNIRKYSLQFGYKLLSTEYEGNSKLLIFKCPKCGEEFTLSWNCFQRGVRCPYCCHNPQKNKLGINTIWDTDRWMCDLGVSEEDAKTHTKCSANKIVVTCPYCGKKKKIIISNIYQAKSIGCSCGDGTSYSEKILISLFNQLGINYIKEYSPTWSNNKRYDFYLPDYNIIIECHGIQHYKQTNRKGCKVRTLQEEQENDQYKKELALNNNINSYIILNCRESNLDYIKNSILNSELNKMFNLNNNINWLQCENFALSNKIKEVCDYWHLHNDINNEGLTTTDIGKLFNLKRVTIYKYLNKGLKLGWCNYDGTEEARKSGKLSTHNKKAVEIFKNGKSLGVFGSIIELNKQSERLFGVKLLNSGISQVCHGKLKQYKGFTFRYITKEEYESKIS